MLRLSGLLLLILSTLCIFGIQGEPDVENSSISHPVDTDADSAMLEIKELQRQESLEEEKHLVEEHDAAVHAQKLEESFQTPSVLGDRHRNNNADANPEIIFSPGLRYRKAQVQDDVLSTRRGGNPGPFTNDNDGSNPKQEQSDVSKSPTSENRNINSTPESTGRHRMSQVDIDRLHQLKSEYAKKLKIEKLTNQGKISVVMTGTPETEERNSNTAEVKDASLDENSMEEEVDESVASTLPGSDAYLFERFKISRKWSRPVEAVLRHVPHPEASQKSKATFYEILGVSPKAAITNIKKTFRQRSLLVHPDKNPHPDAKFAFDVLAQAHEVLSDAETREIYDEKLAFAKQIHHPLRWVNIRRKFANFWDNLFSRILLFFARIKRGQWRDEVEDITQEVRDLAVWDTRHNIYLLYKKFALLPSWFDRATLLGEYLWKWKFSVLICSGTLYGISIGYFPFYFSKIDPYYSDSM